MKKEKNCFLCGANCYNYKCVACHRNRKGERVNSLRRRLEKKKGAVAPRAT